MIPVLPDEIAGKLDDATPAEDAASDAEVNAFLGRHFDASRPEILTGWTKALENHFAAHESRHGSTVSVLVGALKEARAGYFPAADAVNEIRPMFIDEVGKAPASGKQSAARNGKVAASEFRGILAWAVGQASAADLDEVRDRVEREMPDNRAWMFSVNGHGPVAPAPVVVAPPKPAAAGVEHLEQDFWEPDGLRQIYDAALGRMLSPWAVLTHCVARALALVRPVVVLPPLIGHGTLNWFGAVVSASGGGKSAAESLAAELVPGVPNVRNLGSGEGVVGCYRQPGTKTTPPVINESVMFYADEVDCVKAVANRDGATLMSIVRTGFTGGTLGFSYRKDGSHVPATEYRMTLVLSVQPERSGWLFADEAGGTPQRLMWFPGDDPRISDTIPAKLTITKLALPKPGEFFTPRTLFLPDEAKRKIRADRAKAGRGEISALDSHTNFAREKLAYGLAVLQDRTEMTSEDWRRSGIAADVSSHVRDWTQQVERTSGVTRATGEGQLRGVAQEAADDERIKRRVLRWALRTLNEAPGKRMKYRELQNKQTSRDHPWLLSALALGASTGLVACTADGEWKLP